jgi:hypothetical protein
MVHLIYLFLTQKAPSVDVKQSSTKSDEKVRINDNENDGNEGDEEDEETAKRKREEDDDRVEEAKDSRRIIGCMMPALDFTNHRYRHQITWLRVVPTSDQRDEEPCVVYQSGEEIKAGHEVFNNYGAKGNEEFLMGYGFCLMDNVEDEFAVQLSSHSLGPLQQRAASLYNIEFAHYLR